MEALVFVHAPDNTSIRSFLLQWKHTGKHKHVFCKHQISPNNTVNVSYKCGRNTSDKKKVHSQWVCVSLNIANSECAQNLKLLIASYSFCSLVSLKCKIWNNPQMLHTNPHMHGVLLAWDWWTCEVSQMASWFDWHGNIFADSLLPSRYSNWKSSTSGCYQRKFVLCQWYCFWLKPIKKCSTETHLTVSSKQVNKRLLDLQVQMSTSLGCSSGNKGKQSPDKYKELKMAVPNLHVSTVNQR